MLGGQYCPSSPPQHLDALLEESISLLSVELAGSPGPMALQGLAVSPLTDGTLGPPSPVPYTSRPQGSLAGPNLAHAPASGNAPLKTTTAAALQEEGRELVVAATMTPASAAQVSQGGMPACTHAF